jgi:hypothetical protein
MSGMFASAGSTADVHRRPVTVRAGFRGDALVYSAPFSVNSEDLAGIAAAGLGAGMSEQVFHDAQPEFENFRVHRLGHPPNNMINFSTNWVGRVGEAISSFANDKTLHCERRGRVEQATFVARIGVAVETTP